MRYLVLAALAASCVLAKTKAKVNHSANPTKILSRSPVGAVTARQDASGEFCGTDDDGQDWYCDDPSTACCTGNEIWQCAPLKAEECCSTGYYCDAGTHCYLDSSGEQLCLTPEEAEDMGGEEPPEDDSSSRGGSSRGGDDEDEDEGGSGSGSGKSTPTRKADEAEETTGPSDLGDADDEDGQGTTSETSEEEDEDEGSSVAVGGGKKGRKGDGSGAGRLGTGKVMAGVVAIGVLALV